MKSSSKLKLLLRSMDPDVISFPYLCFPWIHELKLTCNRSPERLIWYRKWFTTLMRRVHEANLVTTLHFTTDLKQLLNRDSSGHLISKTLLEESLRASFNHGWQWNLTGNDNSSLLSWGSYNSCSVHDWHFKYVLWYESGEDTNKIAIKGPV